MKIQSYLARHLRAEARDVAHAFQRVKRNEFPIDLHALESACHFGSHKLDSPCHVKRSCKSGRRFTIVSLDGNAFARLRRMR